MLVHVSLILEFLTVGQAYFTVPSTSKGAKNPLNQSRSLQEIDQFWLVLSLAHTGPNAVERLQHVVVMLGWRAQNRPD